MQIEITEKEKTALSILLGLRQKFSREKKDHASYSASELHRLFSELIGQISRNELRFLDTLQVIHSPERPKDEVWGEIDEAIEKSKIKRYDWDSVFGKSLTQEILLLKKQGSSVKETFDTLKKDPRVEKFIDRVGERRKILDNLKISVHARYGENNTAQKVMEEEK
jgi:hypothetical protein